MLIFHIAVGQEWTDAVAAGAYRTSTLGMSIDSVGFIHASTAEQVAGTAARYYSDVAEPLVVLVLDEEVFRDAGVPVVYEDGGDGELYPHLYAELPTRLVREVRPATFDAGGRFVF